MDHTLNMSKLTLCKAIQLCLLLPLTVICSTAFAEDENNKEPSGAYSVMFENDSLAKSDNDYTMGLAINHMFKEDSSNPPWHRDTISLLKNIEQFIHADEKKENTTDAVWWQFGSTDFTPSNLIDPAPIRNDRPYASLVYLSAGYSRGSASDIGTRKEVNWYWGVLGTNVGQNVQTAIHKKCCTQKIPQGWDHQVGEGGSPTFLFQEEWVRNPVQGNHYALEYRGGYSVGYYLRGIAGMTVRVGATKKDYLAQTDTGPQMKPHIFPPDQSGSESPLGLSGWVSYEASVFLHNELLQGAWSGRNDVKYKYSQIEPIVHFVTLGLELTGFPAYFGMMDPRKSRLYYTNQWRSKELRTTLATTHAWGGLYFTRYY